MNENFSQKPALSVIIPVYGVEKYIERCARSLFEQTLDDIEYIFVDDCTKDNSINVLERVIEDYPNRKSQVTIIHHDVNKGLPQARKTGVEASHGDYIVHCDSDDWVDTGMYHSMYEKAIEEHADVVLCDYYVHDGNKILKTIQGCHDTEPGVFTVNLLSQKDPWSLWNKMFRKTIYQKKMTFPEGNMGEDMALCSQLIQYCKKIAYIDKPFYYYYKNLNSISNKLTTETALRNFNAIKDNTDIVLNVYSHINDRKVKSGLLYLQYNVKAHLFPLVHRKEYRNLFLRTYPNLLWKMFFSLYIPYGCKLKYIWALAGFYPRKID